MKAPVVRALAADAWHQVLDNGVFRLLAVLCAVPILFTFAVGFHEEGIVLLFGVKEWGYAGLFEALGPVPSDPRGMAIEVVLGIALELFGTLGILVSLCATAFFVPRMLEKGAAELYFHKPIARWVLLASRFFAGLLFVALVASVLAGGLYLGLRIVSGHDDPGILVSAAMLTYKFVPIYALTVLAGVVMRSVVGALLVSGVFFLANGCIQTAWIVLESNRHGPSLFDMRPEPPAVDGEPADDAVVHEPEDEEGSGGVSGTLYRVLDVLHIVLPKTADADYLGQKLRRALAAPLYHDPGSLVSVPRLPPGSRRVGPDELDALDPGGAPRERLGTPVLGARSRDAVSSLWARPAVREETAFGDRVRERVETPSQAAKALAEELERAGAEEVTRAGATFGSGIGTAEISGQRVGWRAAGRARTALVFRGAGTDTIFTLLTEFPASPAEETSVPREPFAEALDVDEAAREQWYPQQLAFDAPLRFNILFSIGSTLAFAAALLALACWRLARIAF